MNIEIFEKYEYYKQLITEKKWNSFDIVFWI